MTLYERLKGPPIGVAKAAEYVHGPGQGGASKQSKLTRWLTRGVLVDGQRVRLGGAKVGGRWFTSEFMLDVFLAATTGGGSAEPERTPSQRQRDSERVAAKLAAAGW